mgnify:CR=1 FL=1
MRSLLKLGSSHAEIADIVILLFSVDVINLQVLGVVWQMRFSNEAVDFKYLIAHKNLLVAPSISPEGALNALIFEIIVGLANRSVSMCCYFDFVYLHSLRMGHQNGRSSVKRKKNATRLRWRLVW